MQKILLEEHYFYQFYEENDCYFLSVLCGTVAQFDITIQFTAEEMNNFLSKGKDYIIARATEIMDNPANFISRKI